MSNKIANGETKHYCPYSPAHHPEFCAGGLGHAQWISCGWGKKMKIRVGFLSCTVSLPKQRNGAIKSIKIPYYKSPNTQPTAQENGTVQLIKIP